MVGLVVELGRPRTLTRRNLLCLRMGCPVWERPVLRERARKATAAWEEDFSDGSHLS